MESNDKSDVESIFTPVEADSLFYNHAPDLDMEKAKEECVYKTKAVQFLGRTTPIVLQNENGPCPLLAICNVLLLRNNLNLSPDVAEVSQERLLSLVAERLIDSNSNLKDRDAGYIENQQQNVADAIDLLPRLATGIDVNIKFRRIDDFEFTRECAIFDLLDIPLYHGWLVDPQDYETCSAIGSKSYNALTGEIVALESKSIDGQSETNREEDCVDFAAATTATLGVPSPSLLKRKSFDGSSHDAYGSKGAAEEDAELLQALKISEVDSSRFWLSASAQEPHIMHNEYPSSGEHAKQSSVFNMGSDFDCSDANKNMIELLQADSVVCSSGTLLPPANDDDFLGKHSAPENSRSNLSDHGGGDAADDLCLSLDGSEPIYEGEECILESSGVVQQEGEPMYEGEIILAKQGDAQEIPAVQISHREGELIKNFLNKTANQLTFYGLFCLQEGLKERELCVFFRNNHFSTMFKIDGQLYLLATDQGYINQSNLVWEKLNEVNGDSLYMTSAFKEFTVENNASASWDEQNAVTNTADYLASIDSGSRTDLDMNSDLQLAIALQQQEFEHQQQQQQRPPRASPQPPSVDGSRLHRGSNSARMPPASRAESKGKDKCAVM